MDNKRNNRLPSPPPKPGGLSEGGGEAVQMSDHGKRLAAEKPVKKPEKKLIINVDLDQFDQASAQEVGTISSEEGLEEIKAEPAARGRVLSKDVITRLKALDDSYFYLEAVSPPGARTQELKDLIASLPRA